MRGLRIAGALALLMGVGTSSVPAGEFDGSTELICAVSTVFDCGPLQKCQSVSSREANVPSFIRVNFEAGKLSGKSPDGEVQETTVQNTTKIDGKTILQGAENGRAWSLVIDQQSGEISATIADNEVGFVLFGGCTVP